MIEMANYKKKQKHAEKGDCLTTSNVCKETNQSNRTKIYYLHTPTYIHTKVTKFYYQLNNNNKTK